MILESNLVSLRKHRNIIVQRCRFLFVDFLCVYVCTLSHAIFLFCVFKTASKWMQFCIPHKVNQMNCGLSIILCARSVYALSLPDPVKLSDVPMIDCTHLMKAQ